MQIDRDNNSAILHLPEKCTAQCGKELVALLHQEENSHITHYRMDFSLTGFIDSSMIGFLVTVAKEFKSRGVKLTLKNLNNTIYELFVETSLDTIFDIETDKGVDKAVVDLFEDSADIRLEIDIKSDKDICIFHMNGIMNHPSGSRLFKRQFLLSMAGYKKILLNFENLTFFDSLSISVVLSMNKLLRETGGSLRICGANYLISDLFSSLNINQLIPTFDTVDTALIDWN